MKQIRRGDLESLSLVTDPFGDYTESELHACFPDLVVPFKEHYVIDLEKPRNKLGWKGFLNDPHLDSSCDVAEGLRCARRLLLEIHELGLPCATELLDPVTPQYLADLVSWAAIGARTSESQTHREMASGLSMPVGFKNGTDGSLEGAVNAMTAARGPHTFLGIDLYGRAGVVHTRGNDDGHVVLRGGRSGPNYEAAHVARAHELCQKHDLARPVLVDCSHDNSGQDHTRQGAVCRDVARQVGASITDACMGFEETEALLAELADAVRRAGTRRAQPVRRAPDVRAV